MKKIVLILLLAAALGSVPTVGVRAQEAAGADAPRIPFVDITVREPEDGQEVARSEEHTV